MSAQAIPPPPGKRLVVTEEGGVISVGVRRRATGGLALGAVGAALVGGLLVWLIQMTLARAGGLESSLAEAGIGPILALTVVGIAMPLTVIGLMVLRPGARVVATLRAAGVDIAEPGGERTTIGWGELRAVDVVADRVTLVRGDGEPVSVPAQLDDDERAYLAGLLQARLG